MARAEMPEHMGMDALVESLTDPPFVYALLHGARREPLAPPADEDRGFLGAGALRTHREPGLHRFDDTHRDDAPLVAFAGHPHLALDQVEVGEFEPYGLRDPQTTHRVHLNGSVRKHAGHPACAQRTLAR
jgi:hypothetical protein